MEIPPGHIWNYRYEPEKLERGLFGNNYYYELTIEPAGAEIPTEMIAPSGTDIPCHVGVANIPNLGAFFPSICEPCPPGASVGLPPGTTPTLAAPAAKGGCLRPRFFNGMFITSEDMETLLRWTRLKQQMQNRAMGQGVVWGLNVDRDGHHIRVHPGYAVDCCGHDLVVTTPYCVDINTLLRDPAARPGLEGQGPHRMHLLLEYVECPEEPRPVHGDPCSPQVNRCEMSRIRETVRLRLVPPRDYEPDGPIGAFLRELGITESEQHEEGWLSGICWPSATVPVHPPFNLYVRADGSPQRLELEPHTANTAFGNLSVSIDFANVYIELCCEGEEYAFAEGAQFRRVVNDELFGRVNPADARRLGGSQGADTFTEDEPASFSTSNLRLLRNGRPFLDVSLAFSVTVSSVSPLLNMRTVYVELQPVMLTPLEQVRAWPCFGVPCDAGTDGLPLFPTMLPWSHPDPLRPGEAVAPKVLILSVIHAWMTMESARHGVGTPEATDSPQLQQVRRIYSAALRIFGADNPEERNRLTAILHRLLCTWCQDFLYRGPQCRERMDGVVIGCVTVDAGDITGPPNPWGGRRYVIHGPLLTHWGEQIGLAPLDVTISRIMALVCCVAGLHPPTHQLRESMDAGPLLIDESLASTTGLGTLGPWIRAGHNLLFLLGREPTQDELARFSIVDTQDLRFADFVHRVVSGLQGKTVVVRPESRWIRYRLTGATGIEMLTPAPHAKG